MLKKLKNKYELYEEVGVKEYWIVSPQDQWLRMHTLYNGKFTVAPYSVIGGIITSSVLPGFSLSISAIFQGIDIKS